VAESRYLVGPGESSVLARLRVPKTPEANRQALSALQLDEIWAALSKRPKRERYRAIAYVRLLEGTGLKRNAARTLLLSDLHIDTTGNRGWITVTSKGIKQRKSLDRKTVAPILEYLANERPKYEGKAREPLFLTEAGEPFTENGFGSWTSRIADDLERLTPSGIKWSSELMRETWQVESTELIRDPELRRRCEKFLKADGDHDQAVREACVVLEDRVRQASGATSSQIGVSLMEYAFGGDPPRLRLASHAGEQGGAKEIYRGVTAFYRNGTAHRVRDDFDADEAGRVVAMVDHLLWLVEQVPTLGGVRSETGVAQSSPSRV
jgi:uncharacterized protein (TIGR02391 family)